MVTVWEILARFESGPVCSDKDFDLKVFSTRVAELVKEYDIRCDSECVIPSDDSLADDVFKAGLQLAIDVGVWCRETSRRITFREDEIKCEMRSLPTEIILGLGKDSRRMKHRFVEDTQPPLIQMGPLGQSTSEENFIPEHFVFAREPLMDYINNGSLTTLYGAEIKAGSPLEVEAGKYEIAMVKEVLRRVGRPGMLILGVESSIGALGEIAAASSEGGFRISDGHMVAMASELKTDYPALSKLVHILGYGALVCGLYTVMIGGFAGGAEGAAITRVAGSILGNMVYKASFSINDIRDLFLLQGEQLKLSRLRNLLWAVSVSQQAMSRNSKMIIGSTAHGLAGPGTEMLFNECAVTTITDVVSGTSFMETSFAAENKYPDHPGVLEARFTAELAHAIAGSLKRDEADELVRKIISDKLKVFEGTHAPAGNAFKELYDLNKLVPKPEYLAVYGKVRHEMQDLLGTSLDVML
jgi:methylamine--corrinoid protein Co-methyltransferase